MDKQNEVTSMNIHQKLLKIADMAGVLQKKKDGFNYKYVEEQDIQAKVTAGMQKYHVMLYSSLVPGTLEVTPYHYDKPKTRKENNKTVDYTVPVNEVIVKAEVKYSWVNTDNPEETVECYWAYIGQMEDASQAFGAGATYGNRYYLVKALQLATTEDDPDNYRTKQKQAENYEDDKAKKDVEEKLQEYKTQIKDLGSKLINLGVSKESIMGIVSKHNNGNGNPSSIKDVEICESIITEFNGLLEKPKATKKPAEKKTTTEEKKQ